MKLTVFTIILTLFCGTAAYSQKASATPKTKRTTEVKPQPTPEADPAVELEKALALESADERMTAIESWLLKFPNAPQNLKAREILTVARATVADSKLRQGDAEGGIMLFKLAVSDLSQPIPDKLFNDIVSKFPANLYFLRHQTAAFDIAQEIEKKSAEKPGQLLTLASFYLSIENSAEAKRLAQQAIAIEPSSSAAYQTLGMAERLSFDQPAAIESYKKAIELDPTSKSSKLNLADQLRGIGKADEAISIYREILVAEPNDRSAKTGLTLALFAAGKTDEAETELSSTLALEPRNVILLGSAAYHFAAVGNADRAQTLAKQAIQISPRYIWSHLALGRSLMLKDQPIEAEKVFINARQYGNFPLLSYEIAIARAKAGFFEEAVDELKKVYSVNGDQITTKLGNRVERSADNLASLLALEKQASIFDPLAVERSGETERLTSLLRFVISSESSDDNNDQATKAADTFVGTDDAMMPHRKLYAASKLLDNNKSADTALKMANDLVGKADDAVKVENASAVVMASELADGRSRAFAQNEFLVIPEVARTTLSAILRGRIEETIGRALLMQNDAATAETRFKRAIGVLPEKSAWWRSAVWQLGKAQEATGNDESALKNYIASYTIGKPDMVRYFTIETLYKKINGNTEGLEKLVGTNPLNDSLQATNNSTTNVEPKEPVVEPTPQVEIVEEVKEPVIEPTPQTEIVEETKEPVTEPTPQTEIVEEVKEPVTEPTPQAEVVEEVKEPIAEPTPTVQPKPASLFEPVIIRVPSAPKTDKLPETNAETTEEQTPTSADNRQRVLPGIPVTVESLCTLSLSQQTASLLNNGGSVGILLTIKGDGEPGDIIVENEFTDDIAVEMQSDIGVSGKKFFVVKSFSEKTGTFKIKFRSGCGEALLSVIVR